MSKHILRCLFCITPILFTSCVDFDSQTCSFRYDAARDELRIFQVYERIFAEGSNGKLTAAEATQVASFTEGERTFFFGNWIFEYTRKEHATRFAELRKEIDAAEPDQAEMLRTELKTRAALLESVKVTNGDFYLNKQGHLSGYQKVTLSNVSKLIEMANQGANLWALSSEHGKWTEQVRKFAKEGGKWVTLDGNQLTIKFFSEDVADTKEEMGKWMAGDKRAFDGAATYEEPFVKMTFGEKHAASGSFHVDNRANGKYNTLVLDHIRGDHEVVGMLNVNRVRDEFLLAEPEGKPTE